ncbi:MAG TPA: SDR family NAD(P)-dependent oxidoreductase [Candidatus Binataceae bacterium]|nr:SDR family NAD(P)-dependent oxidoreductase [Candidatus Binataceae bacterium]
MENLSGKVAVITGGASGIGFATAKALAAKGAKIVIADIEASALDKAVATLSSSGAKAEGVVCDVANLASVQHLADTAFSKMGAVHIVFNNAGVAINGHIAQMKHSDWEWIIKVDLWGPIHGVEAFLPRLIEQKQGGQIVFTSSIAGLVPTEGLGTYSVAKYGVVALAEVLRREVRQHNIGVSVLCPLRVETNIGSSERNRTADFGGAAASPRPQAQASSSIVMAGEVMTPDAVATKVVDAIIANRLYILPHDESRDLIRRRFERIDKTFDEQRSK